MWDASDAAQGGLIPISMLNIGGLSDVERSWLEGVSYCLIISHDCDIHRNADVEPFFEILPCHPVRQADGNALCGRHIRNLQIKSPISCDSYIHLYAHQKIRLPKPNSPLMGHIAPLSANHAILVAWLAARYRRQALPNALNRSLQLFQDAFKKHAKSMGQAIYGVWVNFDPQGELTNGDMYECTFIFVYSHDVLGDKEQVEQLVEMLTSGNEQQSSMKTILADQKPAVIANFLAISDDDFTLADARKAVRWYYDHYSLQGGQMPPED